jgi:glutamine amidotransferase
MTVLVVDYGMGNLPSVARALEECGADVEVSDDPAAIKRAERLVLPGVGAFADASRNLIDRGWLQPLREAVQQEHLPLLGICLGMQLLGDGGDEGGEAAGLALIPGRVHHLTSTSAKERIPHVGWNELYPAKASRILEGVPGGCDFYFVHSFHFVPTSPADVLATTPYCGGFVAAVEHDNVVGCQFHPEKSSRMGRRLLQNFLRF